MINEIAAKLRLTAVALGCASRKELCVRFRAVNPTTQCDLDRLNKWMQGRALPRSPLVYADWVRVIGTSHDAAWLMSCELAAFATELETLTGVPPETLRGMAASQRGGRTPGPVVPLRWLAGQFACYSHAWSPYFRGRLLRSSMVIRANGGRMEANYHERLGRERLDLSGRVAIRVGSISRCGRGGGFCRPRGAGGAVA